MKVWYRQPYLNYGLILFLHCLYTDDFFRSCFFIMFILLLFFIIRFHYKIYQLNKATNDDEQFKSFALLRIFQIWQNK
jgi:hypothetical protein